MANFQFAKKKQSVSCKQSKILSMTILGAATVLDHLKLSSV